MTRVIKIPIVNDAGKQANIVFQQNGDQSWTSIVSNSMMQDLFTFGYLQGNLNNDN
jgi:hypothetical protein